MDKKLRNKEIRKISSSSTLPILIFTIFIIVGSCLINCVINNAEAGSVWTNSAFQTILMDIIMYPVLMPILYFVFYKHRGKSQNMRLRQTLVKPQRSVGWCVKWIIISVGVGQTVGIIFNVIFLLVTGYFGFTPSQNNLEFGSSILENIFIIISLVVFAPILEEMLFRGIVCRNNEEMGQWFAVIISGIIFGLWHTNYSQLAFATTFGIMVAIMYVKTRSIIPGMIAHFINNFIGGVAGICQSIISSAFDIENFEDFLYFLFVKNTAVTILILIMRLILFGMIIAGIVLLIIEIVKRRKAHKMNGGKFEISTLKKTLVYFSSPVTIATFALMIIMMVVSVFSFRFK